MSYRFLLAIHDNDGTIPMAGTNNRIPLQGIKTLSGACRRICRYKLNRGKDFSIIDITDNTIYPSDYCEFSGGEWAKL